MSEFAWLAERVEFPETVQGGDGAKGGKAALEIMRGKRCGETRYVKSLGYDLARPFRHNRGSDGQ